MHLPTDYQKIIHLTRYARWNDKQGRRETWEETVGRYFDFFLKRSKEDGKYPLTVEERKELKEIQKAVLALQVMPSMRCLMTAGKALERDEVAGFNCSYLAIDGTETQKEIFVDELDDVIKIKLYNPRCFDEMMYVLLCGTGVGFSVERQFITNLPRVGDKVSRRLYSKNNKNFYKVPKSELSTYDRSSNTIIVEDSKYGWASAFRILVIELYNGNFDIQWDVSKIRPRGARLKTFGGRASGPDPLIDLFSFAVDLFKDADGRKLSSLECHDLVCKIADIVVVGGVRRSALISLSNLSDERMRRAKENLWYQEPTTGEWKSRAPHRALANNSVAYTEHPDMGIFMDEWQALYNSNSGERGIFNRAASKLVAKRNGRRDINWDFGTNPCSEIILRSRQFCNLTESVVRYDDTLETLKEKVRKATILGTLQATLTDFVYLSADWRKNTSEESLLGVSLTGIMDHPVMSGSVVPHEFMGTALLFDDIEWDMSGWLAELKQVSIDTNKEWAEKLGIPQSAAITCVKPSGTVSQLVNSASGIHARHSKYYIRTVRADKKDPVAQFLMDQGVPHEDELGKEDVSVVFSFPVMTEGDTSVMRNDRTAIEQLEIWKLYATHWCEHKPSVTISVKEHEWMKVGAWVWENFDILSGVSFLPFDDHVYPQAPYQDLTEEEYNSWLTKMPKRIEWERLPEYEKEDHTTGQQELACVAGVCELG